MRRKKRENAVVRWIKDVLSLIIANKIIALIVLAFIVITVIGLVLADVLLRDRTPVEEVEVQVEDVLNDEYVITDEDLQVDAVPEINSLMQSYYAAAASGDIDTICNIKTGVDDKEKIVIAKKAEYVEDYPVVTCYSKSGPVADSYIVFAYYEVKLFDYEQTVPGLNAWYVCKRDDGSYYINDDEQDEKLANYCKAISVQDDYVDLTNTVNVKFNEAVAADEKLAAFLEKLPDLLTAAVGEELSSANEPQEVEEVVEEETVVSDTTEKKAKATDVVNVRKSDSESADRVGKVQKGDVLTVYEQKVNGWSRILYNGEDAYIKSEYLEVIGEGDSSESSQAAIDNSPSSGKAKATDTVNIRANASTSADILTKAYKGDEMTVVEKQSDGWTKVKFNGKTGYVKSEYLE